MSVFQNLFLGPYAAFPFPTGAGDCLPEDEETGENLGWRSLHCTAGSERAYYMPRTDQVEEADNRPHAAKRRRRKAALRKPAPREMYFGGQPAWPWQSNLVDVDTRAEIDWFAREYATELAEIEAAFGTKPVFGWGLLCWTS